MLPQIDRLQLFNFLRITLDDDLSWNAHVNIVKKKISKVIVLLYRLKHTFPIDVLETLYTSLIASYINSGVLLWGSKSHKIKTLQKKTIRLITNSEFISHTNLIKILKIQNILKLRLLKLYYNFYKLS